eukprot:Skav231585  [mRNA]  locus=scaffold232:18702:20661:+ [translate_table: standard]
MGLLAAKKSAMAAEQNGWWCCAYCVLFLNLYSHMMAILAAWLSTPWVLPVYFALHFLLALMATNLGALKLVQQPLMWLFPEGSSVERKGWAFCSSWWLRMIFLIAAGQAARSAFGGQETDFLCREAETCEGLPAWLVTNFWDSEKAFCYVEPSEYTDCLDAAPWYGEGPWAAGCAHGSCNQAAARCNLAAAGVVPWRGAAMELAIGLGPPVATLLLGMLELLRCCCSCAPTRSPGEAPPEVGLVQRVVFSLKVMLFYADLLSDFLATSYFFSTGNVIFAILSLVILAWSAWKQCRQGRNLLAATKESLLKGEATEDLEVIMMTEKSLEAPLQLMLQFYGVYFVTSNSFAVVFFVAFSLPLSMKGTVDAAYDLIELRLFKVLEAGHEPLNQGAN